MKYTRQHLFILVLISFFINFSALADDLNVKATEQVKKTLAKQGITVEEIGNDLFLLKGETPILIFDKEAQYILDLAGENHVIVESELSYAEIVFGKENVYVSFYDKKKDKVKKMIF